MSDEEQPGTSAPPVEDAPANVEAPAEESNQGKVEEDKGEEADNESDESREEGQEVQHAEPPEKSALEAFLTQDFSLNAICSNLYNNRYYWEICKSVTIFILALKMSQQCYKLAIPMREYEPFQNGLSENSFYLVQNGRKLQKDAETCRPVHVVLRVFGGKGGFGSMLRAIGAQIEKTTNREACRDLSGRRLRDINEEQRLKNWIATQADRDREAAERKKKKLEKLCEKPRHEFQDETYEKERSVLPDLVEDAVEQGMKAACSSQKRHAEDTKPFPKKKAKLWLDDDMGSDISSSEDETESTVSKESGQLVKT